MSERVLQDLLERLKLTKTNESVNDHVLSVLNDTNEELSKIARASDDSAPMVLLCVTDRIFKPDRSADTGFRLDLMHEFNQAFIKALSAMTAESAQVCWIFYENLLLVLITKLSRDAAHEVLTKTMTELPDDFGSRLVAGDAFCQLQRLPEAMYLTLLHAEYARFIGYSGRFFDVCTREKYILELKHKYPDYYLENYERAIISAAISGNISRAALVTRHFLIKYLTDDISVFPTVFSIIKNILRLIMSLIAESPQKLSQSDHQYMQTQNEVENSSTLEQMIQALDRFFALAQRHLDNNRDYSVKMKKVNDITKYIDERYRDCLLSEEMISEAFNLSISYLSRLFKAYVGVNLSNYIQMLRMDEAKRMLVSTDRTIDEIARLVGYSDGQALMRLFRKYEGMTPTAFKKLTAD